MSAAEKLRALGEAITKARAMQIHDGSGFLALEDVRNALPQIVAVVEAAERNQPFVAEDRFLLDDEVAFKAALAALDEALK